MSAPAGHLDTRALLAYWFGETDTARTEAIDLHLLGCERCGESLDALVGLGDAVREAFDRGQVHAFVSAPFVQRLVDEGRRVREYRLAHNGSVNCSAAPQDEVLVARFEAPLAGVRRVDAVLRISIAPDEYRALDIPFDAANGQIVMSPKLAIVRTLPEHRVQVRFFAHDDEKDGTPRVLGDYTLNHSPWPA